MIVIIIMGYIIFVIFLMKDIKQIGRINRNNISRIFEKPEESFIDKFIACLTNRYNSKELESI